MRPRGLYPSVLTFGISNLDRDTEYIVPERQGSEHSEDPSFEHGGMYWSDPDTYICGYGRVILSGFIN